MDFIYYFGEEEYCYMPDYKEIHDFLVPVLVKDLGKTKEEVEEMLEDDNFYDEMEDYYFEDLKNYFEQDAEEEYKNNNSDTFDGFDSYEHFCRWRNPSL